LWSGGGKKSTATTIRIKELKCAATANGHDARRIGIVPGVNRNTSQAYIGKR
jgi:hypothetical protein